MKDSLQKQVVLEYIKKFPNTSNRSLARKIYNENDNNKLFLSVESTRFIIRRYKGQAGSESRKYKLKTE
jgi:hypothetical protein